MDEIRSFFLPKIIYAAHKATASANARSVFAGYCCIPLRTALHCAAFSDVHVNARQEYKRESSNLVSVFPTSGVNGDAMISC